MPTWRSSLQRGGKEGRGKRGAKEVRRKRRTKPMASRAATTAARAGNDNSGKPREGRTGGDRLGSD
uniref:Uncharacterized protein n=1 Tax=Oryza sativa subsp. japonica TaxID=39947 RepID=Q7F0N7_ORYSJ|nr:hypothetical protein [Oryza sativa Japonica Group]